MSSDLHGGSYDEESNLFDGTPSKFDDEHVRKAFIRKVYAILIAMLTLTFGVTIAFSTIPTLREWGHTSLAFLILILIWISIMVLIIVLACNESLRRSYPHNIIFLAIFTVLFSFALGITASYTKPFIVIVAIGITLLIVIALTLFALQTKYDFTIFAGILFCFLLSLLVFAILLVFFKSKLLFLVYATLGALLMSCYIVVDTQMMMSGKHIQIDPEEYVFAALNLYVDIVTLFVYILAIFGGGGSE